MKPAQHSASGVGKPVKRFLGIHFDFHAQPADNEIGKTLTPTMVRRMIDQVKPDYVQCDCKGHPGYASYPTKVGTPATRRMRRDPLRVWRDATASRGVALYVHYSGVIDECATQHDARFARILNDGTACKRVTGLFGPYVDEVLIRQLEEISQVYRVDGAWVDGDCWAVQPDYCETARKEFEVRTGLGTLPKGKQDPGYDQFLEIMRQQFKSYLKHYVETLRRTAPGLEVTSNWAFSSYMPEPVSVDLPFLSGDYAPVQSYYSARFEGRCLAEQGKPWDLMAWSFAGTFEEHAWSTKSSAQLKQEASAVLALGGGFQAYFQQNRDASIQEWQMSLMAEVAKFCRSRERICYHSRSLPQVGLHYSTADYYRLNDECFNNGGTKVSGPIRGMLNCLLDGQASVDVLMDHHLHDRLEQYPLLLIPQWPGIDPALHQRYLAHVSQGGRLVVVGAEATRAFADALGVTFDGASSVQTRWFDHDDRLFANRAMTADCVAKRGTRTFSRLWRVNDRRGQFSPGVTLRRLGKGWIAGVYADVSEQYTASARLGTREMFKGLLAELFPDALAKVEGSSNVEVVVRRHASSGNVLVHLINTSGPHGNRQVHVFDQVVPLGPLTVHLTLTAKPRRIVLHPQGKPVAFKWSGGMARLTLEGLAFHDILEVQP